MGSRAIVEYFSEHDGYRCGYCGGKTSNYSHGMWTHVLTVQDYLDLIDRGWRRSGKYCYKPTMQKTCCPHYTIRNQMLEFKLSTSQKRVLKRVHKYLNDGTKPSQDRHDDLAGRSNHEDMSDVIDRPTNQEDLSEVKVKAIVQDEISTEPGDCTQAPSSVALKTLASSSVPTTDRFKHLPKQGSGADLNKPPCKKAKERRLEKKLKKLAEKGMTPDQTDTKKSPGNISKQLEQYLEELKSDPAHKLEIKLVRSSPQSKEFTSTLKQSFAVYKKYQVTIHNDKPEDCKEEQWKRFLVDSPLKEEYRTGGPGCGYGSFHQQYWLDGQLICVGVIDILPRCISSVYLYYDPDFMFLSLGTYSALREIEFTRSINKEANDIQFYYMGYYIHSCPKMKYKGQYYPSFILCPEAYTWVPIEKCRPKLDASKYSRLEEEGKEDEDGEIVVDKVLVLYEHQAMPYVIYKTISESDSDQEVQEYARLVGKKCAYRMLLFRS